MTTQSASPDEPEGTRILRRSEETLAYKNRFMEVRHTRAEFGSFTKDYFVVHFGPRVGVIIVKDGKVLLVRQYRFLIDGLSWEIPGGTVDAGETLEQAALRECKEETGLACCNLRKLAVYYPGLDNVENRTTIFLAEDDGRFSNFSANEAEVEDLMWIPLNECMRMIRDEEILDAMSVTGLMAYQVFLVG